MIQELNNRPVESEKNNKLDDLTNTMGIDDNKMGDQVTDHNNGNNKKQRINNRMLKRFRICTQKACAKTVFQSLDKNCEDFLKMKNDKNY